jgi:hypothetical protein
MQAKLDLWLAEQKPTEENQAPHSAIQVSEPLKDRVHVCGQLAFPFHFFPCNGMSKLQTGGVKHLSSDRNNCMSNSEFRRPAIQGITQDRMP